MCDQLPFPQVASRARASFIEICKISGDVLLFTLGGAISADAATIQAASCNRDQVASAISSANDGDTVVTVSAGRCTWTSSLTIDGKSITLQGAGPDVTTIVDGIQGNSSSNKLPLLVWVTKNSGGSPAGFTRMTGFTFHGGDLASGKGCCNEGMLEFYGSTANLRVDHNKFQPQRSSKHPVQRRDWRG